MICQAKVANTTDYIRKLSWLAFGSWGLSTELLLVNAWLRFLLYYLSGAAEKTSEALELFPFPNLKSGGTRQCGKI
jgi:hypothetical protein